MEVRNLISEQFVIHLARLERRLDGLRQQHHLLQESGSCGSGKVLQFGGMQAGDKNAVAGVVLPGSEQGDGMRELPDEFVGRQFA